MSKNITKRRQELIEQIEKLFEGAQKALNPSQKKNILLALRDFRNPEVKFDAKKAQTFINALKKYQGVKKVTGPKVAAVDTTATTSVKCIGHWAISKDEYMTSYHVTCDTILTGTRQELGARGTRCDTCFKAHKPAQWVPKNTKANKA